MARAHENVATDRVFRRPALQSMSFMQEPPPRDITRCPEENLRLLSENLSLGDLWWAKNEDWLKSEGYTLRPRYQPGWVPSWSTSKRNIHNCEDSLSTNMRSRSRFTYNT